MTIKKHGIVIETDRSSPSRTRPVSAGAADDQYLSRRTDPWRCLVGVLPNLTDGTRGDRHALAKALAGAGTIFS
jgi:hypothetical protein